MDESTRDEAQDVLWCTQCGIPHAAGATYCSHCGQPLGGAAVAATDTTPAAGSPDASTAAPVPGTAAVGHVGPAEPLGEPAADTEPLAQLVPAASAEPAKRRDRAARATRLPRRTTPASDAEIEATAAAIVARAKALDEARERSEGANTTQVPETLAAPHPEPADDWPVARQAISSPPPSLFAAMPERDRIWLIAGIVLCVVLILFAVFFARNLAGVG